jgi:hypothetical protein
MEGYTLLSRCLALKGGIHIQKHTDGRDLRSTALRAQVHSKVNRGGGNSQRHRMEHAKVVSVALA